MEIHINITVSEQENYNTKKLALSEIRRVVDPSRLESEANAAIEDAQVEFDRQLSARRKAERAAKIEAERAEFVLDR